MRVVTANREKGQYRRGSGTKERTVSFTRPVRAVLLFDQTLDHVPAGVPIERWLDGPGVGYTPRTVERFCHEYGANHPDAEIILERSPGAVFDLALSRFLRECRIE